MIVLYRQAAVATTDARGRGSARIRIAYNPARALRATLTITARAANVAASYALSVRVSRMVAR